MATISDRTKEALQKLTTSDGKIIVTDDMSDDLKEAIEYINENNIDIFNTDFADSDDMVDDEEEEEVISDDDSLEDDIGQLEPLEPFDESELDASEIEELDEFI